jgi:hypothetical protein
MSPGLGPQDVYNAECPALGVTMVFLSVNFPRRGDVR